jgi:CrcB protein
VNVVGCLVVGVVMAAMRARPQIPDGVRLFAVVGVCGGLTTFSTWMVTDVLLVRDGARGVALLDLVGSLLVGVAAVWLGFRASAAVLGAPAGGVLDVRDAD